MIGVILDDEVFVPFTSILEINMKEHKLWLRYDNGEGGNADPTTWHRSFKTCVVTDVDPQRGLSQFHDYGKL